MTQQLNYRKMSYISWVVRHMKDPSIMVHARIKVTLNRAVGSFSLNCGKTLLCQTFTTAASAICTLVCSRYLFMLVGLLSELHQRGRNATIRNSIADRPSKSGDPGVTV